MKSIVLILSRHFGESIIIGDDIIIQVIDTRRGQVWISITAPKRNSGTSGESLQSYTCL